ncbi:MAG: phenylalanine--tRNA ligase subunit alpha [Patescibacteria group bacterium]
MSDELKRIEKSAGDEIRAAKNLEELEKLRIQFLGRERGALTLILRRISELPLEERAKIGQRANKLRQKIEALLDGRQSALKQAVSESVLRREWLDVTRPGIRPERGHLHPITKVLREIEAIFASMGFVVAEGPEVETEYYNFDALNIPEHHPARDMWDTFWLRQNEIKNQPSSRAQVEGKSKIKKSERLLLRTHTSPVQIRYMEAHNPPIRIISPGRCYRHEATDASHEIQFYQLEGLMVDRDISIANFKSIIQQFFSRLFGEAIEIRLRPSYFPFVEPGFEVDIRRSQKSTFVPSSGRGKIRNQKDEWLEIAGAGMVHPNVFKAVGYNPKQYQGFAFGMGVDRIAMMKYKIPDIRLFHSGDLRFLKQF